MSFQTTVNRQFTTGFPGEIIKDGPLRAAAGRIVSADANNPNRIGRVFGYSADGGVVGSGASQTYAAECPNVVIGGTTYFGVLGHPKHYALRGSVGDTLGASYDLPQGAEGEFFTMATGLVVEIANETTGTKNVVYGSSLAYVPAGISGANNPNGLPIGAIVAVAPGGSVPTGMLAIPGSKVLNPISIAASAPGAVVAGVTTVSLTQ